MNLLELPVDVIERISNFCDADSRACLRKAHPLLGCGVWRCENALARKCVQAGVALPPKSTAIFAAKRGFGIDYCKIIQFDPFGSDLYGHAWQGPKNLTTTTLSEVRANNGDIIRKQATGLRPNFLMRGGVGFAHAFASASVRIDLDIEKVGISQWMVAERNIQFTVVIRGVKTVSLADLTVISEMRSATGEHLHLDVVSRREEAPIEGWGEDVEIVLATSTTRPIDSPKELRLALSIFSDFVLFPVEIYAAFVWTNKT